jgi:hypothetical protein
MALSNYTELKAAVADWLDRTDLTARIPDFIRLAEVTINRRLRERGMRFRQIAPLANALPATFAEAITLRVRLGAGDGFTKLDPLTPERAVAFDGTETGRPRFYTVDDGALSVYPTPDAAYERELVHYARLVELSLTNPTNWLLADHPDAYLYGALMQAAPFLRDPEFTSLWSGLFGAAIDAIKVERHQPVGKLRTEIASIAGRRTTGFDGLSEC